MIYYNTGNMFLQIFFTDSLLCYRHAYYDFFVILQMPFKMLFNLKNKKEAENYAPASLKILY